MRCSKEVLFPGLVVTRYFTRAAVEFLARALSVERSLAANQGVLKVLYCKRFRCAAARSETDL